MPSPSRKARDGEASTEPSLFAALVDAALFGRAGFRSGGEKRSELRARKGSRTKGGFCIIPSGARNPSWHFRSQKEGFLAPLGMTLLRGPFRKLRNLGGARSRLNRRNLVHAPQFWKTPGAQGRHDQRTNSSQHNGRYRSEPLRCEAGLELPNLI
jgi:hypothetical protein